MKLRKNPLSDRWDEALTQAAVQSARRRRRQSEEWHIHISPARHFRCFRIVRPAALPRAAGAHGLHPVLEFLPGYRTAGRTLARQPRAQRAAARLDGARDERKMMLYNEHIAPHHGGGKNPWYAPWRRTTAPGGQPRAAPPRADSLLRLRRWRATDLCADGGARPRAGEVRKAIEMMTPAEGVLTERFDIRSGSLGVRIRRDGGHEAWRPSATAPSC